MPVECRDAASRTVGGDAVGKVHSYFSHVGHKKSGSREKSARYLGIMHIGRWRQNPPDMRGGRDCLMQAHGAKSFAKRWR